MSKYNLQTVLLRVLCILSIENVLLTEAIIDDISLITNFTVIIVKSQHVVLFACNKIDFINVLRNVHAQNQFMTIVDLSNDYKLSKILKYKIHAKTACILDCNCKNSSILINEASNEGFFNKTYQWLLWHNENSTIEQLLPMNLTYLGPNAQITYVNKSQTAYQLWDVHSKGRHLKAPLELVLYAEKQFNNVVKLHIYENLFNLQSIHKRQEFHGLTLRGASVIDQENITNNYEIEEILSRANKDSGVSAFSKYHYELLSIMRERFNFTVNFRNARGWAGRLGNTRFRLGYLGILKRNEADIGASAAFNRINRFAEFDILHQSWKFETAFLYRFTPDLDAHGKSGNFLAPFDNLVWLFAITTVLVINIIWRFVAYISHTENNEITSWNTICLRTIAAICQQVLDPIPKGLPTRTIILTIFLFSLVMYNYYTSSVVGGLLSSTVLGPSTINEIIASPLQLSFEDIGYYKVLFKESNSSTIKELLNRKVLPPRDIHSLPVYTHINEAIPYIKHGSYAFHCEVVDAYPEIAKNFDANEICELRIVSGLLETEIMNWIVTKNSQYTELFRTVMHRAREVGLIERLLRQRQPKKPSCQALYTVYPVSLSGVLSAFYILLGGTLIAFIAVILEIKLKQKLLKSK